MALPVARRGNRGWMEMDGGSNGKSRDLSARGERNIRGAFEVGLGARLLVGRWGPLMRWVFAWFRNLVGGETAGRGS